MCCTGASCINSNSKGSRYNSRCHCICSLCRSCHYCGAADMLVTAIAGKIACHIVEIKPHKKPSSLRGSLENLLGLKSSENLSSSTGNIACITDEPKKKKKFSLRGSLENLLGIKTSESLSTSTSYSDDELEMHTTGGILKVARETCCGVCQKK